MSASRRGSSERSYEKQAVGSRLWGAKVAKLLITRRDRALLERSRALLERMHDDDRSGSRAPA